MKKVKCETISPIHEENIDNYIVQAYLGKGQYGVVYKCRSILDNQTYVLKKINIEHDGGGNVISLNEAQLL